MTIENEIKIAIKIEIKNHEQFTVNSSSEKYSVVIGIGRRPRLVLGWVTVSVCQFLVTVLADKTLGRGPWRCSCGDSMNLPLRLILYKIHFYFFFNVADDNRIKCISWFHQSNWIIPDLACRHKILVLCFLKPCMIFFFNYNFQDKKTAQCG